MINLGIEASSARKTDHHYTEVVASSTPSISVQDAITKAETALNGKYNDHPTTLEFIANKDDSLSLTHVVQIQNNQTSTWVEAFVDAHSGQIAHITDFVAKASASTP